MIKDQRGEGVIELIDQTLKYTVGSNHPYAYFKSKSFEIHLDDIKVLGLYHTLLLDDELDVMVFVNASNEKYFIPITFDLEGLSFVKLCELFNLDDFDLSSTWEEHEKGHSKIVLPLDLRGRPLYRRKNFIEYLIGLFLKFLQIIYVADGPLTKEIKSYQNKNPRQ